MNTQVIGKTSMRHDYQRRKIFTITQTGKYY